MKKLLLILVVLLPVLRSAQIGILSKSDVLTRSLGDAETLRSFSFPAASAVVAESPFDGGLITNGIDMNDAQQISICSR